MLYRCLLAAMALSWAASLPVQADSMPRDSHNAGQAKGRLHIKPHAGKSRMGKRTTARRTLRHGRIATAVGAKLPPPVFHGRVSFYGPRFNGRKTANGERFDQRALTMAHLSLPFGTLVRVTNLQTQHSVVVRVNDRGPYIRGRVADLSHGAASHLKMLGTGVVMARLEVLGKGARQARGSAPSPAAVARAPDAFKTSRQAGQPAPATPAGA